MNIELGFFLKKIIGLWLMPLNFSFILFFAYWIGKDRYPRFFHPFFILTLLFLMASSCSKVVSPAIAYLEDKYPVQNSAKVGYCTVHVLGSASQEEKALPAMLQLSQTGLMRLTEGLRQIKLLKGQAKTCTLVLSGSRASGDTFSHAKHMAQAAQELGYRGKIVLLEEAKDTTEEAQGLQAQGIKQVVLVTSALHMHRSIQTFREFGIDVTPAPTDYLAGLLSNHALISTRSLAYFTKAWHEYLGLLWLKIRSNNRATESSNLP